MIFLIFGKSIVKNSIEHDLKSLMKHICSLHINYNNYYNGHVNAIGYVSHL